MATRWHHHEYDAEYERHAHPERIDHEAPEEQVFEGYDPIRDRDLRFAQDWGELVDHADERPDPIDILPGDMLLSNEVCECLRKHPDVDLAKIGVYAEAGVVTLRGTVGSTEAKRRVLFAISSLRGVARVIDRIDVFRRV